MIGVVWAVAWRIVATLWSLASLTLVALVVGAVRRERRQKRADVRRARATGQAMGWPTPDSEDVWTPAEIERRHLAQWASENGWTA